MVQWAAPLAVLLGVAASSLVTAAHPAVAGSVLKLAAANMLLAIALNRGGTGVHLLDGVAMLALVLAAASPVEWRSMSLGSDPKNRTSAYAPHDGATGDPAVRSG